VLVISKETEKGMTSILSDSEEENDEEAANKAFTGK
ncbi:hypothetical protein A2U01_0103384, partial [Trifolium medium]|nr:hypothetical protein [Trifolium medium]